MYERKVEDNCTSCFMCLMNVCHRLYGSKTSTISKVSFAPAWILNLKLTPYMKYETEINNFLSAKKIVYLIPPLVSWYCQLLQLLIGGSYTEKKS